MESSPNTPSILSDEQIFQWEYLESINKQPIINSPDYAQYNHYKNLKARYIFEVTNWFQVALNDKNGNVSTEKRDTSIKQIEGYVNGKLPI